MEITYWEPEGTSNGAAEKFIERCARVSHRSEDKITDDSYKDFLSRVVLKHHDYSVCEHVAYSMHVFGGSGYNYDYDLLELLEVNPTINFRRRKDDAGFRLLINARHALDIKQAVLPQSNFLAKHVIKSADWLFPSLMQPENPMNYLFDPCDLACTVKDEPKFITASYFVKGISRVTETQLVRHRKMSFTVMSGRKVNLSDQDFVYPESFDVRGAAWRAREVIDNTVDCYATLSDYNIPRQDARYLLPQGMATELVVTATLDYWNYFFSLRSAPAAQWEIRELSRTIQTDLHNRYPQFVELPLTED